MRSSVAACTTGLPLSAARTEALAGAGLEAALVEGFRIGFFGSAGVAVLGMLLAISLVRGRRGGLRNR